MTSRGSHTNMSVGPTVGAAFAGFTIGAILFGVTLTQVYHYFVTGSNGSNWQKATVMIILVLDTAHFAFSIHMMFSYILELAGNTQVIPWVVWSLKAMGSTQTFFVIYVQGLYLYKMWNFSRNPLLSTRFRRILKVYVVILGILATGVGLIFLIELQKVKVISNFTLEFEYVIYVGFGATALIDMGIAAAMCLMLYKSSGGITKRSSMIVTTLIQYVVGTGLLTSLGALMCMVLYIAKPSSLLYLGVEYSSTRLYAISVYALYNSQARLREQWNQPADLKGSSALYFAEPDKVGSSGPGGGGNSDGFTEYHPTRYPRQHRHRSHRRRRTSSMPDTPDSQSSLNMPIHIFHDPEETLVQESFNRPASTPPTARDRPGRYWTA